MVYYFLLTYSPVLFCNCFPSPDIINNMPHPMDNIALIQSAIRTVRTEDEGLTTLINTLERAMAEPFAAAVRTMGRAEGRIIVSGMGKSGHIGRKIAATLASTGTPASFVHAAEASHGDLGMITARDVILALSWSGETAELKDILEFSRRFTVPLIAMTASADSALGKAADIVLELPKIREACPHGLAPTTSTTLQLVLGDALAVALLNDKGFTARHFKTFHPGGRLGAQLSYVRDVMHSGSALPLASQNTIMADAIVTMTQKSFGCLGLVDDEGRLAGIITDGDLRRAMAPDLLEKTARQIMTTNPKSVPPDMLASQALEILNASAITSLFVTEEGVPAGIVHVHDLLRSGII